MSAPKISERIYLPAATLALQAAYLSAALLYPNEMFGFNQLHIFPPLAVVLLLGGTWAAAALLARIQSWRPELRLPWNKALLRTLLFAAIPVASILLFVALRSRHINADGAWFLQALPRAIAEKRDFLLMDELLESYVHSRFFLYANLVFPLDVRQSYHVISALAGGVFVFILLSLSTRIASRERVLFLGLVFAGGYMQLFFGDIEHYSFVAAAIALYLAVAWLYLEGKAPLFPAALCLGLAMGFHLLAAWLLPAHFYLVLRSWRSGRKLEAVVGVVTAPLVFGLLLGYFHFHGLPLEEALAESHLGGLYLHSENYLHPMSFGYWRDVGNLWFLLLPQLLLFPLLLKESPGLSSQWNGFLLLASLFTVLYTTLWNAQLGVYDDWNLFAPLFIAPSLYLSENIVRSSIPRLQKLSLLAFLLTVLLHTSSWILGNHFLQDY